MGWPGLGAVVVTTLIKDPVDPVSSRMGFSGHPSFTLTFFQGRPDWLVSKKRIHWGQSQIPQPPLPIPHTSPGGPAQGRLWGKQGPGGPANRTLARLLKMEQNPLSSPQGRMLTLQAWGPGFALSLPSGGDTPACKRRYG